jgi:hypothetical protein
LEVLSEFKEIVAKEEVAHEDAPNPNETTTESSRKRKRSDRKRGDRGLNRWPDDTYRISKVSPKGHPLAPKEALPKFRNALGYLVRDNLDITVRQWKDVADDDKKKIWDKLVTRFIFPRGSDKLMKEYAMKQWAIMF